MKDINSIIFCFRFNQLWNNMYTLMNAVPPGPNRPNVTMPFLKNFWNVFEDSKSLSTFLFIDTGFVFCAQDLTGYQNIRLYVLELEKKHYL